MRIFRNILKVFFFLVFNLSAKLVLSQVNTPPTFNDKFSKKLGNLRLTSTRFDLGRVNTNDYLNDTIRIYNAGKTQMKIWIAQKIPVHMRVLVKGSPLNPGGYGYIALTYDCSRRNDLGFTMEQVELVTNDSAQLIKNIYVSATIEQYFPQTLLQDSLRGRISIPQSNYNFNKIKQGNKVNYDFKIYNVGKRSLQLNRVKTTSASIKFNLSKKEIAAGDSALMHVEFDTAGRTGIETKQITVFTNDPEMSECVFQITGEVFK
jgi:hypothetical protein